MIIIKKRRGNYPPPFSRLAYLIAAQLALITTISFNVQAEDYFNPDLLQVGNPEQGVTDLSVFENSGKQAPGIYRVDIYINDEFQDARDVAFRLVTGPDGKESLQPCISALELAAMGVRTSQFKDLDTGECANFAAIPQASTEFRFNSQQLLISIPQAAISQKARGSVSADLWDNGIPALLLNYSMNGANTYGQNSTTKDSSSQFVNLRPGLNIGSWRVRNYSTYNRNSDGKSEWDNVYTYAQTSIVAAKALMSVGDFSSSSDIFDSVTLRGIQLASDDDMLPESMQGYAPVVRGIARTNAQVIIRQNGYIIYQNYVSPGPFQITDMYPTGGGGDLFVTIKEDDGSKQHLIVPFASLPVLQREGRLKYGITTGRYRSSSSFVEKTPFSQATAIYGLPHGLTAYSGVQYAQNYQSLALGVGKNLGSLGAFSTDVTQAWSTMQNQPTSHGQSWRIRYSKNLSETGTNISIAGYRYSTEGYYALQEVLDSYRDQYSRRFFERRRNRAQITLSQNLWEGAGSLSLSLINEDYWNTGKKKKSVGVGYNNSYNGISYGLNYSYNQNSTTSGDTDGSGGKRSRRIFERDQIFAFNISVPLSRFMANTYATYSFNTSKSGNTTNTVGLNGSALEDSNLNWSAQQGHGSKGDGDTANLTSDYRGTYGDVNAGYAYDKHSQRWNYGLQGGVLVHENGVTLGQPLGETIALVKAPGAKGIGVANQTGVKTDWRGYAIVPYVSPYRKNQVQLDTRTLPDDVDLTITTQTVIPTRGAVVRANFDAQVGYRVLMTLLREGGAPLPFGATVTDPAQSITQAFIVGESGQVYLSGMAQSGILTAKWGHEDSQQCQVKYALKEPTPDMGVQVIQEICKAGN